MNKNKFFSFGMLVVLTFGLTFFGCGDAEDSGTLEVTNVSNVVYYVSMIEPTQHSSLDLVGFALQPGQSRLFFEGGMGDDVKGDGIIKIYYGAINATNWLTRTCYVTPGETTKVNIP